MCEGDRRSATCHALVTRSFTHVAPRGLDYASEQYMGVELEDLGCLHNHLKSPDHLGWLYKNANKPRSPTNRRHTAMCSMEFVVLVHIDGDLHWWV